MSTTIAILDWTAGTPRSEPWSLELTSSQLTARELIRRRVEAEVNKYNRLQPEYFRGLVQPEGAEALLNGYHLRERRSIDAEAQTLRAFDAFARRGFVILAGERQVEELDEDIELQPGAEVTFLRLVPLVGG